VSEDASTTRHLAAALSLHLDAVTAEVVGAFRAVGVRTILLRGPAVENWLYQEESVRSYVDVDLLVEERTVDKAAACLEELGFADVSVEGVLPGDRPTHARTWSRADRALVDLHTTILGVRVPGDDAWAILAAPTDTVTVAGLEIETLAEPARALMLALHAAQHGARSGPTLHDLQRAVDRLPFAIWQAAAALAARLDATDSLAVGLRLLPTGEAVASRLALPAESAVDVALRASGPPPMALGFEWLSRTPGWRGKALLAARKIVPSAAFMRAWSPLAGRGRIGLGLAYLWRPIWLALHAGPAFLAWRRARKSGV
jgi:Uncharacterised nucleotidyltransferase